MGNKNDASRKANHAELSEDAIEILMANTHYNRFEVIEWFEGFSRDYPTGKLTKAEFEKAYKQIYPDGNPKKYSDHVFSVFDTDSNGSIDFKEFLLALSALSDRDVAKRLHLAFKVYDINHNGQIDAKELGKLLEALYDLKGLGKKEREGDNAVKNRVEMILRSLDKDHSGTLSEEEFVDGCLNDAFILQLLLPPSSAE